jgi:hypothetical protein
MVVALLAFAGSGACLSSGQQPGFALVFGAISIVLSIAGAVWIFVRKGQRALYLLSAVGLLLSVPLVAYGFRGSCS